MDERYDDLLRRLRSTNPDYREASAAAQAIEMLRARVAELKQLLTHTGLLQAQEEHNALRHDIERHVEITAQQAQELEQLRVLLTETMRGTYLPAKLRSRINAALAEEKK